MKHPTRDLCVVFLACALAFSAACRATRSQSDADAGFRSLIRGYQSGITERSVRIARTEPQWQALWKEHTAHVLPRPDVPDFVRVDWTKEMVIGVFAGARPTAGYGVEVRRVRKDGDRIVVEATESKPAADMVVPQVVTYPYHFIIVPEMEGEGRLELR